jgi:cytochrome bd-type quinol oxidase subunit 2
MGGADFGGGMWDLLAAGPRAARQRKAIAEAIGPIWEANHVWLILVVVLLFTGFPIGFAGMTTALNIPLTVMLIGIVLRGSAFIFRNLLIPLTPVTSFFRTRLVFCERPSPIKFGMPPLAFSGD